MTGVSSSLRMVTDGSSTDTLSPRHKSSILSDVAMDDDSAAVEVVDTGDKWVSYSDKTKSGKCSGKQNGPGEQIIKNLCISRRRD